MFQHGYGAESSRQPFTRRHACRCCPPPSNHNTVHFPLHPQCISVFAPTSSVCYFVLLRVCVPVVLFNTNMVQNLVRITSQYEARLAARPNVLYLRFLLPTTASSSVSSETPWQTGRCLPARCLSEEPMSRSSTFQVFSSHPFKKFRQNFLVVDMVNGLTFRHPIHVNNPSDVEKKDHHCFKFGFDLLCFLLSWWTGALPVHGLALTFWVVFKNPWLITSYYVL